jgi:hypothetical protein
MWRQDAHAERAHLVRRDDELTRAAERTRRTREAMDARRGTLPRGRIRAATASALRALVERLDPGALREPQLGRDGGC